MLLADCVLFIDAEAMILDKPAGLAVDAPRDGSLSVMNHLDSLRFGFERHPSIVHRLDRDPILQRNRGQTKSHRYRSRHLTGCRRCTASEGRWSHLISSIGITTLGVGQKVSALSALLQQPGVLYPL